MNGVGSSFRSSLSQGILIAISCFIAAGRQASAETTNRIVAIVNDEVITEGDVAAHMSALLQEDGPQEAGSAQTTQMRQVVLQRLIEERLMIQEAKRTGLTVDLEDVARHLHAIQQRAGMNEAYEQMLSDAGLSEEQLKAKIREQLLVRKVIDRAVRSKLIVTPSELAHAAPASSVHTPSDEVQAYHLLIRVTPERSMEQARALIMQLADRLRHGAPLEELAKQYSEDSNAEGGGLMGWVHQGQLLPELDDVLFRLQAGELSEPIQTRLGFHLIKVVARRGVSAGELSKAQQDHEQQLYQEKFTKAMAQWLGELKQRAYIEVLEEVR